MARYNGVALTCVPLADGTTFYCPFFCVEAGLDADAIWGVLGRGSENEAPGLWLDPAALYMANRGHALQRIKFFVNLLHELMAKYGYPGYQHEALEHYHRRESPASKFVVELGDKLAANLVVAGQEVSFSQAIGTLYQLASHNIGAHSDRPADIAPNSFIVDLSFGGDRDFVMRERTLEEQEVWLAKANNKAAAQEQYVNLTGRGEDRVTMKHGSAIIMSTATNSRWTHEVPQVAGVGPAAPRASVIFRSIKTLFTKEQVAKVVAESKKTKERGQVAKEAKRAKL